MTSLLLPLANRQQHANESGHAHEAHHQDHGPKTNATEQGATGTQRYCRSTSCMRNWKITFAVLLFVEGLIFGYFALVLKRFACLGTKRFRTLLSFVNIGGGGIFLATGMLHILPEALEYLEPKEPHAEPGHAEHGGHGGGHEGHSHGGFPVGPAVILATFVAFLGIEKVLFPHSHSHPHPHENNNYELNDVGGAVNSYEFSDELIDDSADDAKRHSVKSSTFLTMLLYTIGIALHSILESVALGSSTRWSSLLNLFIAIATHRWATTMALGAKYERAGLSALGYALLVIGFAAVAPIGVAIGVSVRSASDTVKGVVFALSTGIFLYIGGFETPAEEFVHRTDLRFPKFAVYTVGCAIIAAITGILVGTGTH